MSRCLATIEGYTYRHTDWWEGFMKYAAEMGSWWAMIYIPSFIKIGSDVTQAIGNTHRQHGDRISLLSFFQNKKIRLIKINFGLLDSWAFVNSLVFWNNTTFRKLDPFPSSVGKPRVEKRQLSWDVRRGGTLSRWPAKEMCSTSQSKFGNPQILKETNTVTTLLKN
jgi:hypothetical protein